jgi:hypothetical protein
VPVAELRDELGITEEEEMAFRDALLLISGGQLNTPEKCIDIPSSKPLDFSSSEAVN